jgi:hypothetical protein
MLSHDKLKSLVATKALTYGELSLLPEHTPLWVLYLATSFRANYKNSIKTTKSTVVRILVQPARRPWVIDGEELNSGEVVIWLREPFSDEQSFQELEGD